MSIIDDMRGEHPLDKLDAYESEIERLQSAVNAALLACDMFPTIDADKLRQMINACVQDRQSPGGK